MCAAASDTEQPWTIGRLLTWTTEFFERKEVDEARLSAEVLLAHAAACERIALYTRFDEVPDVDVRTKYRDLVRRAAEQTPIAYLVGSREFFSLRFHVTPDVLIPRPETETLVMHAVDICRKKIAENHNSGVNILDVGTGSGCIAVTLLTQLPTARATATDLSAAALDVARTNACDHRISDRLTLIEADAFHLSQDAVPPGGFDLIVSNPPYVAESEMFTLAPSVREHEPLMALTPGGDGLSFYRTIATDASPKLQPTGHLLVEIGAGQADRVKAVFEVGGQWEHVGTYRTPPDPHDRVIHFSKVC